MGTYVAAFSGGKDSTAMVVRMAELGETFSLLFTPAGNEPPALFIHVKEITKHLGVPLILPENKTLEFWMDFYNALPSWRMRWCTRQIKIEPCIAYLKQHPGSILCVGLRTDEMQREGIYGEYALYRYPLREWGWRERDVLTYLEQKAITVPKRTNCDFCYAQRLYDWWELWHERPERFEEAVQWEIRTGHTFRAPSKDKWPASLTELREMFKGGWIPKTRRKNEQEVTECRVCSL